MRLRLIRLSAALGGLLGASFVLACMDSRAMIDFYEVTAQSIADQSAVITFVTDPEATCLVRYGLTAQRLDRTAVDPMMDGQEFARSHNVPLDGLNADTIYYYQAAATTPDGTEGYSTVLTFQTLAGPAGASNANGTGGGSNGAATSTTDGLVNFARVSSGTTVAGVSSEFSPGWAGERALDGNRATAWATAGDGDDAWLELDLGQDRTITHVGYQSRSMADGSSIVTSVQFTIGGINFGPYPTTDPEQLYVYELGQTVTAATVRFDAVQSTGGNTGGSEIAVYGPQDP